MQLAVISSKPGEGKLFLGGGGGGGGENPNATPPLYETLEGYFSVNVCVCVYVCTYVHVHIHVVSLTACIRAQ